MQRDMISNGIQTNIEYDAVTDWIIDAGEPEIRKLQKRLKNEM